MVRIFGLHQNNRFLAQSFSTTFGTIRYVVSFSVRSETNGKRTHKKPSRLPSNYTSYRKHEQTSRSDSRIKKTSQIPRGSGPREARLAYMALSQLEIVLRGKPNLRFKFQTFINKNFFIKIHIHQKPLSSKNHFHQKTTFIKNQFHQRPLSSKTIFIRNHFLLDCLAPHKHNWILMKVVLMKMVLMKVVFDESGF